jgi:O-antigen/teichoic acid export membrane protein
MFVILAVSSAFLPFFASRFFEPVFQIYNRPWLSLYSSLSYVLSYMFLSLIVFLALKTLAALVAAYVFANIFYTVTTVFLARKFVKPVFVIDKTTIKKILKISIPLGVSSVFALINTRIAVFMLARMKSDYEVAIYSAADRFINPMTMISLMMIYPLLPIFSIKNNADKESMRENFQKMIEYIAIVVLPIAILFPLFSPRIILLTFGRAFMASSGVLNIMIWFWIVVTYSLLSSAFLLAKGIVNIAYWNTASAVAISVVLNYWAIPKYGYLGSAVVAVIAEIFLAGVTLIYIAKHAGTIIVGKKWIKIIGANAVIAVYAGMMRRWHVMNPVLIVLTAMLMYIVLNHLFKMISKKDITSVLPRNIQKIIMARYPAE